MYTVYTKPKIYSPIYSLTPTIQTPPKYGGYIGLFLRKKVKSAKYLGLGLSAYLHDGPEYSYQILFLQRTSIL